MPTSTPPPHVARHGCGVVLAAGLLTAALGLTACATGESSGAGITTLPPPAISSTSVPLEVPPTQPTTTDLDGTTTTIEVDQIPMEHIEIDDGTYSSVEAMAAAAQLIIVGDVVAVTTLGRPDQGSDALPDEYVAVQVRPVEKLAGASIDSIVLPWRAYRTDADGHRVARYITNGLATPAPGSRVLMFLTPSDPAFTRLLGGVPTHQLVKLDGLAYVEGDTVISGESNSTVLNGLLNKTITELREEITAR